MRFSTKIILLIAFITIINYLDRSAISFAIQPIEEQLHLSDAQFGILLGGFAFGYLAMSFVSGLIIDRFGYIWVWPMGAAFWSCCTIAFSLAEGFWSLLILRILLGLAEGLHFPALLKTISDWLPPPFRARAISCGLLGIPIALLLGAPFLSFLISFLSWRGMFVIIGLLGLTWASIWPFCFRNRRNPHYGTSHLPEVPEAPLPLKKISLLRKNRAFVANCIAYFAFGYLLFFALLWLPGYLEKQLHQNIPTTGMLLMIPWGCAAIFLVLGGTLSDAIWQRTHSQRKARTFLITIGLLVAGLSFSLLNFSTSLYLDITLLSLGLGFCFFINAPIYALNADLFPHQAATAQGIMIGFSALAGMIAPTITGFLVQATGTFHSAFILIAAICAIGALTTILFQKD